MRTLPDDRLVRSAKKLCKATTIYLPVQRDLRTANRNRVLIDDFMMVDKSNPVRISLTRVNGIRAPSINYIYEHPACSSACAGTWCKQKLSSRFPVIVNNMVNNACARAPTYNHRPARRWSLIATSVEGHSHRDIRKRESERKIKKNFRAIVSQRSYNSAHVYALTFWSSNYFRNFAQTGPCPFLLQNSISNSSAWHRIGQSKYEI